VSAGGVRHRWRPIIVDWLLPVVVAVVLLGPALRPGLLVNLDLVLTPDLDVPRGFWGLGPELPRRLLLWVPISVMSGLVPATLSGKVLLVAAFAGAWIGMRRLTGQLAAPGGASALACHSAGVLYALSPFVLTRAAVGHFNVTVPHAVLPWVLPILLRPGRNLGATFVAAFALGFAGHSGGSVAIVVVAVALVLGDRTRWAAALAVTVVAQAPWAVPGLLVAATSDIDMADGQAFAAVVDGVAGVARLSAGGGFWNAYYQVGGSGLVVAACGAALLGLGVAGTRDLDARVRRPLVGLGIVGWFVAAAAAIPVVGPAFVWVNDELLGGIWREGHRLLTLHLVWLAPAAALGAERLARRRSSEGRTVCSGALAAAPMAIALVLAVPGVWGLGGHLGAEPEPSGWTEVRERITAEPGTVVALPWYQYFNLSISGGPVRRVLNPMPLYLGGDVVASSDNGLQRGVREVGDPRERAIDAVVTGLDGSQGAGTATADATVGERLADVGVRWIVLLKTVHLDEYRALFDDPSVSVAFDDEDIALFEVRNWAATWSSGAVDADGAPAELTWRTPAIGTGDDGVLTAAAAGSGGWRRGWSSARTNDDGLLVVPAGTGPVWNVATLPSLAAQLAVTSAVVVILVRWVRRRRRCSHEGAPCATVTAASGRHGPDNGNGTSRMGGNSS
jgi:hypothetical protein